MRSPDDSLTFSEPVACVKPGRSLLFRLCLVLILLVGVPAVVLLIWAEVTSFNLNSLPWPPRIALAAVVGLSAFGIYRSIEERQAKLTLDFYRDRLVLSYDEKPSLWRSDAPAERTEIRYADVTRCVYNARRCRVTLVTKGYERTIGDGKTQKKGGSVTFSTLGAQDVNFPQLIEKHSSLKVLVKY